jgi:outer membrane lipoprotein-sorting protein
MMSLSAYAQHTVVVNPDGTHSTAIHNGNTTTIVNPDGTHSTAIHNGNSATIVNPDGSHSTAIHNGNSITIVNPDGSHSTAIHNGNSITIVNPDGTHTVVMNNGNSATKGNPKWKKWRTPKSKNKKSVIGFFGRKDGNLLTLDRVVELSAKGEDLTWSDFEQYESKDVGSGLYIYFYDIDDTFGLWIGGVPSDKPMYMRLATKTDMDNAIDIRTGDVKAFIKENKK